MDLPLVTFEPIPLSKRWQIYLQQRGFLPIKLGHWGEPDEAPNSGRARPRLVEALTDLAREIRDRGSAGSLTLLCRPTTLPRDLFPAHFLGIPVTIVWFGTGREKLKPFEGHPNIRLLVANKNHNAEAVAELNLLLANALLRPIHKAFDLSQAPEMADFNNTHPEFVYAETLAGKTWACLGAGAQVRGLLPLLLSFRVREVRIHNRNASAKDLTDRLKGFVHTDIAEVEGGFRTTLPFADRSLAIFFTPEKRLVAAGADVLSLHAPIMVDREFLAQLPPGMILINTARGDNWDESEIVRALRETRLRAVASDVFHATVEESGDYERSPLYQFARASRTPSTVGSGPVRIAGRPPVIHTDRVLLTPHIAGSTEDSFDGFAGELLPQL